MPVNTIIKTALLGQPSKRASTMRGGLPRRIEFPIDTAGDSMQLLRLWPNGSGAEND